MAGKPLCRCGYWRDDDQEKCPQCGRGADLTTRGDTDLAGITTLAQLYSPQPTERRWVRNLRERYALRLAEVLLAGLDHWQTACSLRQGVSGLINGKWNLALNVGTLDCAHERASRRGDHCVLGVYAGIRDLVLHEMAHVLAAWELVVTTAQDHGATWQRFYQQLAA